ncbi:MAG: glycosyltransferase family 4 protein [Ignavibacteria bacterium]|nr:glycosyltransferase family 4 protein [Ignavibacteria bacterium]
MKIVILTQYFYPETGAPQNRLLELSQMFTDLGWKVKVVTALPNYPKGKIFAEYSGLLRKREKISGIDVERYWLYASNQPRSLPRIVSMLSISFTSLFSVSSVRKFRPDYIFAESPPLTLALSGLVLARSCGAKLLMNVSDIWPLSAKELGSVSDGKLYRAIESLEKYLYRNAFMCTGQSEEIVDHLRKSGAKRQYLFRNGVDVKRFAGLKKPEGLSSGKMRIIYAGLLGVAQKISVIAEGIDFTELGCEFHIYGEGAERIAIQDLVSRHPERGVFLHDPVPREKVPALLSEFDCALIPLVRNIYGAVPSKIYEAMSAGLPILFSGSGEGAAIVSSRNVGLVNPPGDLNALSGNIRKLIDDARLLKQLSENCTATANKEFDRNKIIPEFAEELKKYLHEQ